MNKIWIFEDLDQVSGNYHSGGGLVIVAKNIEMAKLLVSQDNDIEILDWDKSKVGDTTLDKAIYVFPDAGCC